MGIALVVLVPLLAAAQEAPADRAAELWRAGRRAEAIEAARAELSRRPEPAGLRRRVAEWEVAVHRYEAALADLEPLGPEVDALRGEALFRLGRYEEALQKLDAGDPLHALMRVDALWALARFEEADAALEEAAGVVGKEDSRVLSLQGRRLARIGRPAEAAEAFRAALDRDPLLAEALFGIGQALLRSGEREAGLAALERHRALLPLLDALDFARR
ncbi:MAG TPA: tetratricopeptide repeat protein, partial [Planctomycetota bacterium]|nr:tetratricopeptide repeat protein [Planctomycetota bacterium]